MHRYIFLVCKSMTILFVNWTIIHSCICKEIRGVSCESEEWYRSIILMYLFRLNGRKTPSELYYRDFSGAA